MAPGVGSVLPDLAGSKRRALVGFTRQSELWQGKGRGYLGCLPLNLIGWCDQGVGKGLFSTCGYGRASTSRLCPSPAEERSAPVHIAEPGLQAREGA